MLNSSKITISRIWIVSGLLLAGYPVDLLADENPPDEEPGATAKPEKDVSGDAEKAKKFFRAGLNLLKVDNLQGAAREFEQAVSLHPTISALFNLANCYKGLYQYEHAMRTFKRLQEEFAERLKPGILEAVKRHEAEIIKVAAELVINVDRDGATVSINGSSIGESPLDSAVYLSPGNNNIVVVAQGFEPHRETITVYSGQKKSLNVELKSSLSFLLVESNVEGATLLIDGQVVGQTPFIEPAQISAGPHLLELSKSGYLSATKTVKTRSEETIAVEFLLVPATAPIPTQTMPLVEREPLKPSTLSWVGLGLTLGTGLAAGTFYLIANSHYQDFKGAKEELENTMPLDPSAEARRKELEDTQEESGNKTELFANLGLGFAIGAGVFAIATGISFGLDIKKHNRETRKKALSFGTTPTSVWIRF